MSDEPQEFNDGHIIEGMDRCNTIMVMLHELLHEHPAVIKADTSEDISAAAAFIMKAYQKIGALAV